jgi:hypothetical protein
MQKVEVYIEGQRAEMFDDVSVTITDTIKDVRDVNKVFTEYSQTFSLPASKTNNKIFKHYYNNDIVGGFDARIRVPAKLELNSIPFKTGYIKLEGVDLRGNKAHTYRITFFGNTISLKNLLGEDLLSDLDWLNNFSVDENGDNLLWNPAFIEQYLTESVDDRTVDGVVYPNAIQVPLITHTQRLYYDSDTAASILDSGDLHYHDAGGTHRHGVKWNELKFAIKLKIIIKAIENQYGIVFSSDFFDNDDSFQNLYMWLHRTKGGVTTGSQITEYVSFVEGWSNYVGSISRMSNNALTLTNAVIDSLVLRLEPNSASINKSYSVTVFQSGNVVYQSTSDSGIRSFNIPIALLAGYTVQVASNEAVSFDLVRWSVDTFPNQSDTYDTTFNVAEEFIFNIQQQIPKMKVIDFLTSIFRMFNLVAYVQGGEMVVKTLDSFYSSYNSYDITKYVDVSKSQTNVALPFREIVFTYEGLGTFLAKQHNQLFNKDWGREEYKGSTYSGDSLKIFSEGIYNYKIPFEHMKFERLIDLNTSDLTDIQWGFCVDDNESSYIGKPLIFYMDLKTLATDERISFVNSVDPVTNEPSSHTPISSYYAPANSDLSRTQVSDRQSLNFSPEPDEWELVTTNETLFNNYHINYISSVFNESNRLNKITAYLPLRILYKYTLADRFIVSGKSYKINSIETDFYTGKSEIELLSDI